MFEAAFANGPCEFIAEEVRGAEDASGVVDVAVSFRVVDKAAWSVLLPRVVQELFSYRPDFVVSGPRKEYYFDEESQQVKFLWAAHFWSEDQVGLRLAVRALGQILATPMPAAAKTTVSAAPPPRPRREDEEPPGEVRRLAASRRMKTTTFGKTSDGTIRSATVIKMGRRQEGENLYTVTDPRKRTVKAVIPGNVDPAMSARTGISGRPRVHVEGVVSDDGGGPAEAQEL